MKARFRNGKAEKICLGLGVYYAIWLNIRWMRAPFGFIMMNKIRNEWSIRY